MSKTVCGNCETTQGPFDRRSGYPLCKFSLLEECNKRRAKLDIERWGRKE